MARVISMGTLLTPLLAMLLLFLGMVGLTEAATTTINPSSSKYSTTTTTTPAVETSCEAVDTGELIYKTSDVTDQEQAVQLAEDLLRCPGEDFEVAWHGTVAITRSFELANGTSLTITGIDQQGQATIESGGIGPTFAVSESSLQLQGLTITGAKGVEGGVVAARDGASIFFYGCNITGNTASSKGGVVFLSQTSSFVSAGSNFTDNNADVFGGAIFAGNGSSVSLEDGSMNVFSSNTAKSGGAVYLEERSTVTMGNGQTQLIGNYADFQGGAIYGETDCEVTINGVTLLSENEAAGRSNGGAIFAKDGTVVTISGNTSFIDNFSTHYGGAMMVTDASKVIVDGYTEFRGNKADYHGGAIKAESNSVVRIRGQTLFVENSAGDLGGAISASNGVVVSTIGRTTFMGNLASSGGAICSSLVVASFRGENTFDNNTASKDGGALHFMFSRVLVGRLSEFRLNHAMEGSGGALYCNMVNELTVIESAFFGNSALWGGAVATFSSGGQPLTTTTTTTSTDPSSLSTFTSSSTSSTIFELPSSSLTTLGMKPVKFVGCNFTFNRAEDDGGAIYSGAGYDIIRESKFTSNRAGSSGGALVHGGVMAEVSNSLFDLNVAGKEGPAILSLGMLNSLSDVTFRGNNYYCAIGEFSYNMTTDPSSCRFAEVCSRCITDCESELEDSVTVEDLGNIPICEDVPEGSTTTKRGSTVESLEILPGYFRFSATSLDIRECFYAEACHGGVVAGEYCAAGYEGPYCAVCGNGYAPGYHHTCKSCMKSSRRRAVAGITIVLCIAFVALCFVVSGLISVVKPSPAETVDGPGESAGHPGEAGDAEKGVAAKKRGGASKFVLSSRAKETLGVWQHRLAKRFPLTIVKIIVVVWQIVTQYSDVAGVQYPGAYKDFLSIIDMVNLDVGFILSFACIYDTTFYDRLLFATLGPIVVLVLLGGTYAIAWHRNRGSEVALATVRRRHLSVALFVMFVVYGTVSHTVFETFVCDEMEGGESFLRADYSLECTAGRHRVYQVWASLMVIVYPVGIPCVFGWWLVQHRHDLKADPYRHFNPSLRPAADLWEPYKCDRYYYEVVECVRRVALTGFAVFIYPESSAQIAVVLLLSVIFMVVSEILCPFVRPIEMWLYRTGHYVVFASMYLALLLRVDISNERTQSQEVFSGVLVIAHAAMVLVVLAQGVLVYMGWGDLLETPVALRPLEAEGDGGGDGGGVGVAVSEHHHGKSFRAVTGGIRAGYGKFSSGVGGGGGDGDHGGRSHEEKHEKKRETWVRSAPRAKSSFFQTPSVRDVQEIPKPSASAAALVQHQPEKSSLFQEQQATDARNVVGGEGEVVGNVARQSLPHGGPLANVEGLNVPRLHHQDLTKNPVGPGPTTRASSNGSGTRIVWTPLSIRCGSVTSSGGAATPREPKSERPASLPLTSADRGVLARPKNRRLWSPDVRTSSLEPYSSLSMNQKRVWKTLPRQGRGKTVELRSRDGSARSLRSSESLPSLSLKSERDGSVRSLSPRASRSLRSPTSPLSSKGESAAEDTSPTTGNHAGTLGHIFDGRRRRGDTAGDNASVVDRENQVCLGGHSPNALPTATSPIGGVGVKRGSVCSEQSSVGMAGVSALYLQRHRRSAAGADSIAGAGSTTGAGSTAGADSIAGAGSTTSWNRLSISDSGPSEMTDYSMGSQDNGSPLSRLRARTTFMMALPPHTEESRNVDTLGGFDANKDSTAFRRIVKVTKKYRSLSPKSFDRDSPIAKEREADQGKAGVASTTAAATSFFLGDLDHSKRYRPLSPKTWFPQKEAPVFGTAASAADGPRAGKGSAHEAHGLAGPNDHGLNFSGPDFRRFATDPLADLLPGVNKSRRQTLHAAIAIARNSEATETSGSTVHAVAPMRRPPPEISNGKWLTSIGDNSSGSVKRQKPPAAVADAADGSRQSLNCDTIGAGDIQARACSKRTKNPDAAVVAERWKMSEEIGASSVADASSRLSGVSDGGRGKAGAEAVGTSELSAARNVRPRGILINDREKVSESLDGMEVPGWRAAVKQGWERRFPSSQDSHTTL